MPLIRAMVTACTHESKAVEVADGVISNVPRRGLLFGTVAASLLVASGQSAEAASDFITLPSGLEIQDNKCVPPHAASLL